MACLERSTAESTGASAAVNAITVLDILLFPTRTILLYGILPMPAALFGALWLWQDISGACCWLGGCWAGHPCTIVVGAWLAAALLASRLAWPAGSAHVAQGRRHSMPAAWHMACLWLKPASWLPRCCCRGAAAALLQGRWMARAISHTPATWAVQQWGWHFTCCSGEA